MTGKLTDEVSVQFTSDFHICNFPVNSDIQEFNKKGLNIGFKAITFGTYGAFGTATHKLIAAATANSPCPVYSPWVRPSPKQHAYLLFGFTLARANARMLINAASKRSSAKNAVRTSRSRSP